MNPVIWIGLIVVVGAVCAFIGYVVGADRLQPSAPKWRPTEPWVEDTANLVALGVAETVLNNFDVRYRDSEARPCKADVVGEIEGQIKAELLADF